MTRLLDYLLPPAWRKRASPDTAQNERVLARLDENDPVYRCLMDHAYVQAQDCLERLRDASELKIDFWRGRLSAHLAFIEEIESKARSWREAEKRRLEGQARPRVMERRGVL